MKKHIPHNALEEKILHTVQAATGRESTDHFPLTTSIYSFPHQDTLN
jgi:hypothetical protein